MAARAALKSVRAIPNPRPEDRGPKTLKSEARRPRAEIRRPKPEAERGSVFGLRPSGFGLLSAFDLRPSDLTRLRSSDFRAAEHDLPSTGRILEPPWRAVDSPPAPYETPRWRCDSEPAPRRSHDHHACPHFRQVLECVRPCGAFPQAHSAIQRPFRQANGPSDHQLLIPCGIKSSAPASVF